MPTKYYLRICDRKSRLSGILTEPVSQRGPDTNISEEK